MQLSVYFVSSGHATVWRIVTEGDICSPLTCVIGLEVSGGVELGVWVFLMVCILAETSLRVTSHFRTRVGWAQGLTPCYTLCLVFWLET